jgi:uncharacterized RDD family membrane protein YckC
LVSVGYPFGFASIALTADRQRFGDVTAATVVVRTEERRRSGDENEERRRSRASEP